ncbi:MAG: hypothetical protein JO021_02115 [Alphaproteobacteria bacterium]|nr:hypothetical protein [Alphaproteobacteria bacterium]
MGDLIYRHYSKVELDRNFDIKAVREAGFSDGQIVETLADVEKESLAALVDDFAGNQACN